MGPSNNQAEIMGTLVLTALLLVFIFGIDPVLLWLALGALEGVTFWMAYLIWLLILALATTHFIVKRLLEDQDKPPTVRKIGRIS